VLCDLSIHDINDASFDLLQPAQQDEKGNENVSSSDLHFAKVYERLEQANRENPNETARTTFVHRADESHNELAESMFQPKDLYPDPVAQVQSKASTFTRLTQRRIDKPKSLTGRNLRQGRKLPKSNSPDSSAAMRMQAAAVYEYRTKTSSTLGPTSLGITRSSPKLAKTSSKATVVAEK